MSRDFFLKTRLDDFFDLREDFERERRRWRIRWEPPRSHLPFGFAPLGAAALENSDRTSTSSTFHQLGGSVGLGAPCPLPLLNLYGPLASLGGLPALADLFTVSLKSLIIYL